MPRANHSGHNIDWQSADNGERQLWAAVLYRAIGDAAGVSIGNDNAVHEMRKARAWMDGNGEDFRMVCALAGFDPDFIHDAWTAGRLNYDRIKEVNAEEYRRRKKAKVA